MTMPHQRAKLYQRNGDIQLVCKAYNGRVVLQWLSETISRVAQQEGASDIDDRIQPVALCLSLVLIH